MHGRSWSAIRQLDCNLNRFTNCQFQINSMHNLEWKSAKQCVKRRSKSLPTIFLFSVTNLLTTLHYNHENLQHNCVTNCHFYSKHFFHSKSLHSKVTKIVWSIWGYSRLESRKFGWNWLWNGLPFNSDSGYLGLTMY